jgi:hypothetical protein
MRCHRATLIVPLLLVFACSSDPGGGDGAGGGGGGGDGSTDPVAGRYEITTTYDLTQSDILPDVAGDVLSALTGLEDDPAGTIIALLQAANVPIVSTVLDVVPGVLKNLLTGYINDYVFSRVFEGVPVTAEIAGWVDDIATGLTHFQVISELELGNVDAAGNSSGSHRLSAVQFQMHGAEMLVDTPDLIDQLTIARDVSVNVNFGGSQGTIDIGDHAFSLPIGDFAVTALNSALQAQFGVADLGEALGLIIDCPGLAHTVASKCVTFVCVGHETELTNLCEAGLDQVAQVVEDRLSSIDFAAIHLSGGSAIVVGGKADGAEAAQVSQLDDGEWQAAASLSGNELPIGATFVGVRQAP